MSDNKLHQLSLKLKQLVAHCEQLHRENDSLQQKEQQWLHERARLMEKNELARSRVESMIKHLKNLKEGVG